MSRFLLQTKAGLALPDVRSDCLLSRRSDDDAGRRERRHWRNKTLRLVLFVRSPTIREIDWLACCEACVCLRCVSAAPQTLFLMYPGVSAKVLGLFVCREVKGEWYLLQVRAPTASVVRALLPRLAFVASSVCVFGTHSSFIGMMHALV